MLCLLNHFTQLTHLELWACLEGAVGTLSCLQQLQELTVAPIDCTCSQHLHTFNPAMFVGLPGSITRLNLDYFDEWFDSSVVPTFQHLSALQHLEVCGADRLDTFGSLQQIQTLIWNGGGKHGEVMPVLLSETGPFGQGLSALKCLQLDVGQHIIGFGFIAPVHDVVMYSLLLPLAPHLTRLVLSWRENTVCLLPAGCGPHLFASGRQLTSLKQLLLGFEVGGEQRAKHIDVQYSGTIYPGCGVQPIFGPGDIDGLVHCCPSLEQLWVPHMVQLGVDVSAVQALTALTGLFIGGVVWDDDAAVGVLAGMSWLRQLELYGSPQLTDNGLLALAALTGLTKLCMVNCGLGGGILSRAERTERSKSHQLLLRCKKVRALCTGGLAWLATVLAGRHSEQV
jgi:hypothetical protein